MTAIKEEQLAFLEKAKYEEKQCLTNAALSILYDFTTQKRVVLEGAVKMVRDELKERCAIPLMQYGKLANYLIAVKSVLDNLAVVDECKLIMLENLKNATHKNAKVLDSIKFHDSFGFWEDSQTNEYNEFIQEMSVMFQCNAFSCLDAEEPLDYLRRITELMCDCDNERFFRQYSGFLEQVEIDKIILALERSTAKQVSDFRKALISVYGASNIHYYLPNDKDALVKLQTGVQNLLNCGRGEDKIVQLQYLWLVNNIETTLKHY